MSLRIKYVFGQERETIFHLPNKKVIFVFHIIFKLDFITQIIYCIVSKKWNIKTMLTFPYPCNWQKLEQPQNE